MKTIIHNDWQDILQEEFESTYYQELREFLKKEYAEQTIYPSMNHIWEAFEWTPYEQVKVVILGQDPYHGPNQAHGLSFSVQPNVKVPPSLVNIYKELADDLGITPVSHGYLKSWAEQGVLLMNTVLTVRGGSANSHRGQGWERLTDAVIKKLNEHEKPLVFILWGNPSIAKKQLIDTEKHVVITSPHPSPLSSYRGFFGSKPFSKANKALVDFGETPIDWQLPKQV
ncbi:uracil-DNA glycosylase [Carnobacterium maltaromaticum]|uniref:uracil-DNA glycosylase n=1 Tax=Carnobacterium maltaromaticum TaxID=2751 RepID=UPI000C769528|nr:uracil-DNA glycosylase [Carnobacterium maltaromaticum]PLS32632.1 uracil-DNA glycosylase [Carnobacterium maltaromaticum]PLS32812.1 uracil-DNA glycosylase [Carnobacterium maltaromaticum]PLS33397.1 uracil-DNA glycosylase [Carnobacterium maltaromaticum]PLS40799.1 uracil-DNA glycosylase [Carnobacterium maltaromaticum]PLS41196.1 uracil-DNA glycosylase [Carnobacterium maltaromaticum]